MDAKLDVNYSILMTHKIHRLKKQHQNVFDIKSVSVYEIHIPYFIGRKINYHQTFLFNFGGQRNISHHLITYVICSLTGTS